ncbi:MAG: hypothetical protein ACREB9_06720 [Thermoplasmata archaeon]
MVTLSETLVEVWRQTLVEESVEIELRDQRVRVTTTRSRRLKTVSFRFGDETIDGIEQNPEKPSRWGALAREGKRIMQFSSHHRYFANVCEGALTRYPLWKGLQLPD